MKRYWFSVVEEAVLNTEYRGYRGGRIEVFDLTNDSSYSIYEARFLLPEEFMEDFYEMWDGRESDLMPMIRWEVEGD